MEQYSIEADSHFEMKSTEATIENQNNRKPERHVEQEKENN